jgi:hypothetical protein
MYKNLFKYAVRSAFVSACLCAMVDNTTAGSFTRGCAARDLQILMTIEEREDTDAASADKLNDAILSMFEARIVCHEGRVTDALALYDSIDQDITGSTRLTQWK